MNHFYLIKIICSQADFLIAKKELVKREKHAGCQFTLRQLSAGVSIWVNFDPGGSYTQSVGIKYTSIIYPPRFEFASRFIPPPLI